MAHPQTLTPRAAAVLAQVVELYQTSAAPVGSHAVADALAKQTDRVSSALVRGIMADLEGAGLLAQPHISAGRVPTSHGLRHYVDCLIEMQDLSGDAREILKNSYQTTEPELGAVLGETTRVLSNLSQYVGVVLTPARNDLLFRHMQFVKLSPRRVLGIFVTHEGVTHNRVIDTARELSYAEIERINNYCQSAFVGLTLAEARAKATRELASIAAEVRDVLHDAIALAARVLDAPLPAEILVDGKQQLFEYPEFADPDKVKAVLELLEERRQLMQLLSSIDHTDDVQVFIGRESGFDALADCSVVVSHYRRSGDVLGTLGVIGPQRMAYGRVIPIVQCTAERVTQWIDGQ